MVREKEWNIAYLDCFSGLRCDTLLAALLDTGLSLTVVLQQLAHLPFTGYALNEQRRLVGGVNGLHLGLSQVTAHVSTYTWPEVVAFVQSNPVATGFPQACERLGQIVRLLVEAEAAIQRCVPEEIQISEERLLLLMAVLIGIDVLGIDRVYTSSLPLTSGQLVVEGQYRVVPSPVTLALLADKLVRWHTCDIAEELVTPDGAALLAVLGSDEPLSSAFVVKRTGYGVGDKVLPWPDVLRLSLGSVEKQQVQAVEKFLATVDVDWVTVIESHIDNMTGELLGGLLERLLAAGALDVSYTPIQMKKNRPATRLTVICTIEDGERFAEILLRETTTLGVRLQQMQRRKAQRTQQQIETVLGPLLIKVKKLGNQIISASPEYEECQRLASQHQLPLTDVYTVVQQAIQNTLFPHKYS